MHVRNAIISLDDSAYVDPEDHIWASHQAGKDKEPKKEDGDEIIMKTSANSSDTHQPIPEECRAVL